MTRARLLSGLVFAALIVGGSLYGQDKALPKGRATLPQGWGKLGLSDEQKLKVYAVRTKYRAQIQELEQKLASLRKQERAEMEKVLTAEQRKRLRDLAMQKAPAESDDKGKEDKGKSKDK